MAEDLEIESAPAATPVSSRGKSGGGGANIYTILMFVALAALVTSVSIMWYMNGSLTGQTGNPLVIERK